MPICPHTGITQPECSCSRCLTEQLRVFRPALLEPETPAGIRVIRTRWLAPDGAQAPPPRRAAL